MGTAQAQYQEKRKYPRYSCDLGVEVRIAGAKTGYWGTLADICQGGCYVSTFSPLPMGTRVVLVIKTKNLEINIAGKIVTFHPGVGMGVQFAGFVHPNGEAFLKDLLTQLAQSPG
ncbi:MAG TPA: PilZ domain-containing protein [Candidatus Angelobacter sp.]|nr:PilZ domain-containing protein [Candidatus Angelobacter sp.]